MNCDCKKRIEARLLERFRAEHPNGQDHSASLDGYGFALTDDNKMVMRGGSPIVLHTSLPTKTISMKPKKIRETMLWTFCPFCGTKATGGQQ
jgi:hypothetical protein